MADFWLIAGGFVLVGGLACLASFASGHKAGHKAGRSDGFDAGWAAAKKYFKQTEGIGK